MSSGFKIKVDRSTVHGQYNFKFANNANNANNAIVPVLQRVGKGYRLIGTASFLIKPNIFVTVAHLFQGEDISIGDSFFILSHDSPDYPLEIKAIHNDVNTDISIFELVLEEANQFFQKVQPIGVMNLEPEIGEIVGVFGCSHSEVNPDNIIEVESETIQPLIIKTKWEVGQILNISQSGLRLVKGQCYETSVHAEGRDSGAPLFNGSGFMVGLLSTSLDVDSGLPNSICTSILPLGRVELNGTPINEMWSKTRIATCIKLKK